MIMLRIQTNPGQFFILDYMEIGNKKKSTQPGRFNGILNKSGWAANLILLSQAVFLD